MFELLAFEMRSSADELATPAQEDQELSVDDIAPTEEKTEDQVRECIEEYENYDYAGTTNRGG